MRWVVVFDALGDPFAEGSLRGQGFKRFLGSRVELRASLPSAGSDG